MALLTLSNSRAPWVTVGVVLLFVVAAIDYHLIAEHIPWLYIVAVGALIYTLALGHKVAGSKSWVVFGPVAFQPSELTKMVVVIAMARYLSELRIGRYMIFAETVRQIRIRDAEVKIELLTPDFQGSLKSVRKVIDAGPDIFSHNIETVRRLYPTIRFKSDYTSSFGLLKAAKAMPSQTVPPPPSFHQSPDQVSAAFFRAGCSKGLDGSPGIVKNLQANWPLLASNAEKNPRTGYSAPLTPTITLPFAMRGAMARLPRIDAAPRP